jgi:predicted PurR-regulated permease PerM
MPQTKPRKAPPEPVRVASAAPRADPVAIVVMSAAVIAALYFGRALLVPLALAILLAFVLAPLLNRLRHLGLPRIPAVVTVVAVGFVVLGGVGFLLVTQLTDFARDLPRYEYNLRSKIRAVQEAAPEGGVFERAARTLRDLQLEIEKPAEEEKPAAPAPAAPEPDADAEPRPMPVEIHEPPPTAMQTLRTILGPLMQPLATAGIVIVFVVFILAEREELRDRFIRLVGTGDLSRTTEAITDAARRVSRYLLMQLVVNATYALPVALGLWLIGVPNALLWGLLAGLVRFVPYVGPIIGMTGPIVMSFAVDTGFVTPLLTVGLFVLLELFSNNIMEPWLYGASTGLTAIAIIVAALFWATIWGPIGLLLSTPLTVCLVVLGRHVPFLGFLDVLLGDEPALPVEAGIYQRLLAGDVREATERAEDHVEAHGVARLYEQVLLPVLSLAERDRQQDSITPQTHKAVADGVIQIMEAVADLDTQGIEDAELPPPVAGRILCVAGRNESDAAAAMMLADLLVRAGFDARALPLVAAMGRDGSELEADGVRLAFLSYTAPSSVRHAKRAVRRLHTRLGSDVAVVVGVWNTPLAAEAIETELADADAVVTDLAEAVRETPDLMAARHTAAADGGPDDEDAVSGRAAAQ